MELRPGMVFTGMRDNLTRTIVNISGPLLYKTVTYRREDGRTFNRDLETLQGWANDRNYWRLQHPECLRLPDGV